MSYNGGYSLSAKISALALDEPAPHGCVGYANLRTCDASARSSPNRASHNRKENDIRKGCHIIGGYSLREDIRSIRLKNARVARPGGYSYAGKCATMITLVVLIASDCSALRWIPLKWYANSDALRQGSSSGHVMKKEKTPQVWGVFPLWRALEDSNLRPTGS